MLNKSTFGLGYRGHLPALDGIRGFAVAMVFLHHYGGGALSSFLPLHIFGLSVRLGWSGVSLFFVLSGFLITGILWDSLQTPNWWRRFYFRRSLRIFPLYYFSILLAVVVPLVLGNRTIPFSSVAVFLLYLQNVPALHPIFDQIPQTLTLSHFWSLAVEEQFYIIWPFLLVLCFPKRDRAKRLCVAVWLLSFAFRFLVVGMDWNLEWAQRFLLARAGELSTGAFLALSVRGNQRERDTIVTWAPWSFLLSLLAILIIFLSSGVLDLKFIPKENYWLWSSVGIGAFSVLFASLLVLALQDGWIKRFFEFSVLRWLGKVSYGIYVYHVLLRPFFVWVADRIAPNSSIMVQQATVALVGTIGTLFIASLSFYAFERPLLRLKERKTQLIAK
jgi:peptidoglycan/LPS O-acetylase OafA/YrhL